MQGGKDVKNKLLIIEDDVRLREIISDYFAAKGFLVFDAADGAMALEKLDHADFDIVLLDIMMPQLDGFTVCRAIRKKSSMPVIFLTARNDEGDVLLGYELGADDYITKPFSLPVLYAKVQALIKRARNMESDSFCFEGMSINTQNRSVSISGRSVNLAPKEYDLLVYLAANEGRVLSREQILRVVWGYDYFGDVRAVDTHVKKLRAAMGSQSWRIKTVIKAGYQFMGGEME
jgi:DNA-binding response OmpR family regulator